MSIFDLFKPKKTTPPVMPTITHPVIMFDGSAENYPKDYIITDGENCVICNSDYYHTSLGCENLLWEQSNSGEPFKAFKIKEAKAKKMTYCYNCSSELYHFKKGDLT